MPTTTPSEVKACAKEHFAKEMAGKTAEKFGQDQIRLGEPVIVHETSGALGYWKVPLEIIQDGSPVGFIDVEDKDGLEVVRYGLNETPGSSVESMRREVIVDSAKEVAGEQAIILETPKLVYLDTPTKIVWECKMRVNDGSEVVVDVSPGWAVKRGHGHSPKPQ